MIFGVDGIDSQGDRLRVARVDRGGVLACILFGLVGKRSTVTPLQVDCR